MTKIVTKASLQAMLDKASPQRQEKIVGRALMALLDRQTSAEQNCQHTIEANGIGFSGCDGRSGTISAKVYKRTGHLKDWVLENWLKKKSDGYAKITKYHRQLNEVAIEREEEFVKRIKG